MHNFKKVRSIVFTLSLLMLMCQSVDSAAQISKPVSYRAEFEPFDKIDKEILFPQNHDPFYLHLSFLLSPGTITADLIGEIIFDRDNGAITLRGSGGNLSADGGINFKGSIEMDFIVPVEFYTLLFALQLPSLALVDLIFDLPDIEIPVKGSVTVFDLGPHWRESKSFNSFLLNGKSAKVTAGVRDILSKKLSAVDLAGIIVTATTGIPSIAVDIADEVIKTGLGDSRISLNAGLTSNLTLSGEAIIVNGQKVVREGQSTAAPGLDLSRNSYEVNTTYVENLTSDLNLLFSADIELSFNPLGIEIWDYDEPIAELPINIVPEQKRDLDFSTTPNTVVFPIDQTPANHAPQPVGSIGVRLLTMGGSAARGDISPYFSDTDNDRLTYSAQSDNTSIARVSVSGSEVTITPRGEGSAQITVAAADPGGLTATQTVDVTVKAEHRCEYTLSQNSLDAPASGGPLQVDVTTTSGCDWNATTTSDFLSVSLFSGTGSGAVSVTVDSNTRTRSRSGRLTIAGKTFTVRQDGMTTIASQDLSGGDAIIVQNTLNLGLNIRSEARIPAPPEDRNSNRIGKAFDGATGEITGGPHRADGFKWWEVDWDNAPTGWSVEAIDEDLLILRRPPDLAIESFRVSESTVDPGEEFKLSLTVRNKGYNESESATLHYYYSSTAEFAAADVVGVVGKDSVGRLDPDDTSKEQISAKAPLTPGTYYYGVFLAGTQYIDDGNILNDDDPRNNFAAEKQVKVRKPKFPDLVVQSPSVSKDAIAPEESFSVSATVRNRGSGESRFTTLRYYRSSNSTISTDDIQVETDRVSSLDPDETDDESVTLRAPSEAGVYYYGACVDSVRNESDTDNNCSDEVRITVRNPDRSPDLLTENIQVSDSILTTGAPFTVSATVRNRSADSSDSTTLRYYRSTDSTISTSDTEVKADSVGALSDDGTSAESETLTAPSEEGIYYYGVCVDSVIGESDTNNNCSSGIPVAVRTSLNQAPEAVNTIPAQALTVGGSAANVGVSGNFQDPDNNGLTYTTTSDNTGVATVSVSDALVTITPESVGSATVTVTASDGTLIATQRIAVTVEAAPRTVQTLEKISGDNQQGASGATLTNPFIVEVRDANGNPFEGILVTFVVTAGGGSLSTQTATTDANGRASTTLTPGPNAGTNTVEVSVTGISASARFTATAQQASNQAPQSLGSVSAQTLSVGGSAATVNVSGYFHDPENDSLTYTATSDNTKVATISVSGALVTITPESVGSATVTVIASDGTLTATQRIAVTVEAVPQQNQAPVSVNTIPVQTLTVGGSAASINVSGYFQDPDNNGLTYTTTSDNTGVATVSVSDALVTITPESVGSATVTVTASDGTLTATQRIAVTVKAAPQQNQAPVSVNTIPAQALTVGGSAASINVSGYFQDPDNNGLTYTTTSDNTGLATVSVSDALVTITPESVGSATVTVTASDGTLTATQRIAVTVEAAPRIVQTLEKISGDNQQGAPGATLTNPFIVEVRDANGDPFEGILVTFVVTAGGGSLSSQTATTDANGRASTTLTPGPNAGANTVEVSVTGISASARFTATAQEASNQTPQPMDSVTSNQPLSTDSAQDARLRATLKGHTDFVTSVAFSPDGRTLASGSWDKTIRLWNPRTAGRYGTLTKHGDRVTSVAFSPNGNMLASGSWDKTVRFWNPYTGGYIRSTYSKYTTHETFTSVVAADADGDSYWFASGSLDNKVWLWYGYGLTRYVSVYELSGHTHDVSSVAFSADERTLASGSHDNTVKLWYVYTQNLRATLKGHTDFVTSVAFSPDGRTLASGSWDNTIRLWEVATGESIKILNGHTDRVLAVAFSPDGRTLASGSDDQTIRLWDAATGRQRDTLLGHTSGVTAVAFSPDRRTLASAGGWDNTLRLWDLAPSPTPAPTVRITPSLVVSPAIGANLVIKVDIGGVQNVAGYQATVQFDPTALRYVESANGSYLPAGALFVPPVVNANQVTLAATSLDGDSDGAGTLATLTFEVVAVKPSQITLSDVMIMEQDLTSIPIIVQGGDVVVRPAGELDINGDGVVNIQDLTVVATHFGKVGNNQADVNGDNVVDIKDLLLVAGGLNAAAAPSAYPLTISALSAQDIRMWLSQAQQHGLNHSIYQEGIAVLQQLLTALTPKETALLPNYPNPFNPETWIPYRLATDAPVRLCIYDRSGCAVRTINLGHRVAGVYERRGEAIYWDGRNDLGERVTSGLYFYTLTAGDYAATRRMLVGK